MFVVQGSRRDGNGTIMDHHTLHTMADGRDARDGPRQAVRPVPRARPARLRRQARPLHRGPAASRGRGEHVHHLHGHRRQVPQEVPPIRLPRLPRDQAHLLHPHLRLRPLRPLPPPQLQLHLDRVPSRSRHVANLLDHCVDRVARQGRAEGRRL